MLSETYLNECFSLANRLKFAVEQSERDRQANQALLNQYRTVEQSFNDFKDTINRCTIIYKDVQQNLDEKKQFALDRFRQAIDEASKVVRNSDVAGAKLKVENGRAVIVNNSGQAINAREGSAFRSVAGMLMRYTSLISQMNALPLVLLDESFFTLSDNSSLEMMQYLEAFSQDVLVIGIEQRNIMFAGINGVERYTFVKNKDKITRVRKEVNEDEPSN